PELGISARDRGKAVHVALQLIWTELETGARLRCLTADETIGLVVRHVRTALANTSGLGRSLEQQCVEKLLLAWLEKEKRRPPFSVFELEREHEIHLGGMSINARFDRVDQLEECRHIILDYKTGEEKNDCWPE